MEKIKRKKGKRKTEPAREWVSSRLSPWFLSPLLFGERHWEGFAEAYSHLQSFERTSPLLYHPLCLSFFLQWKIKSFWIRNSITGNYVLRGGRMIGRKKKSKKKIRVRVERKGVFGCVQCVSLCTDGRSEWRRKIKLK